MQILTFLLFSLTFMLSFQCGHLTSQQYFAVLFWKRKQTKLLILYNNLENEMQNFGNYVFICGSIYFCKNI